MLVIDESFNERRVGKNSNGYRLHFEQWWQHDTNISVGLFQTHCQHRVLHAERAIDASTKRGYVNEDRVLHRRAMHEDVEGVACRALAHVCTTVVAIGLAEIANPDDARIDQEGGWMKALCRDTEAEQTAGAEETDEHHRDKERYTALE
jgi:hypothetical protein